MHCHVLNFPTNFPKCCVNINTSVVMIFQYKQTCVILKEVSTVTFDTYVSWVLILFIVWDFNFKHPYLVLWLLS